jgi:PIN domain nuclease of toxin-antitoxin system
VRLLLDTHAFLWWEAGSRRLGHEARHRIATADIVWVSAATAWEIAIKRALGRIDLDEPLTSLVERSRFAALPVTFEHAERAGALPPHHADPFDRMLIAQAHLHAATIVSHDRQFEAYGVPVIWT